jgi:phage virion morphogenesis protein
VEIRFEIVDNGLAEGLRRALAAATDFTPAMAAIAGLMEAETRQRFEKERGPDEVPWLPSRRALEEGGRTLTDSGALLSSIASASTATEATVGTNLIYAAIHQKGGTIRPKAGRALATPFGPRGAVRMPARPFLGFSLFEQDRIEEILAAHLETAFGSAT